MILLRRAGDRRHERAMGQEFWITFDPLDGEDALRSGFGALLALVESRISPGSGTESRSRNGDDVLTYVHEGTLAQEDGKGRTSVVQSGEFQRASAEGHLRLSERNASSRHWAHVFRLSLLATGPDLDSSIEQKRFSIAERRGKLRIVASPDGRKGSLRIHADALLHSTLLKVGQHVVHVLAPGHGAWLHVVDGEIACDNFVLVAGDGAGIEDELAISFRALVDAEVLLFDFVRSAATS